MADFSGKNQKQRVHDALEIIQGSQFLSAAVQSTSPTVLKAVKRENVRWCEKLSTRGLRPGLGRSERD